MRPIEDRMRQLQTPVLRAFRHRAAAVIIAITAIASIISILIGVIVGWRVAIGPSGAGFDGDDLGVLLGLAATVGALVRIVAREVNMELNVQQVEQHVDDVEALNGDLRAELYDLRDRVNTLIDRIPSEAPPVDD